MLLFVAMPIDYENNYFGITFVNVMIFEWNKCDKGYTLCVLGNQPLLVTSVIDEIYKRGKGYTLCV